MAIVEQDKIRGVVTLDSIVRSALMDIGESMARYEVFKHWAIEGFKEFYFDMAMEIKTTQLPLTPWKAIQLPIDYVDWVMIGVVINNQIRIFTNDETIPLPVLDEDEDGFPDAPVAEETLPVGEEERLWFWGTWNTYGEDTGQLYGLTVKDNGVGYYKMNTQRREIQFSPAIKSDTKIYLEYISDGYNPCEATVVNAYAGKLIKLYIHMCRHQFARSSTQVEKREARDAYEKQWYKVQNRIMKSSFTVSDVLDAARDGYKLAPYL